MILNPVPNVFRIERLGKDFGWIDARGAIFRQQLVRIGGLGEARSKGHIDHGTLQFWCELSAQGVDQFDTLGVGHQCAAGKRLTHNGGAEGG